MINKRIKPEEMYRYITNAHTNTHMHAHMQKFWHPRSKYALIFWVKMSHTFSTENTLLHIWIHDYFWFTEFNIREKYKTQNVACANIIGHFMSYYFPISRLCVLKRAEKCHIQGFNKTGNVKLLHATVCTYNEHWMLPLACSSHFVCP